MANMTRAQMVSELQSRGWSRYVAADLQRYLDWALQDIYGMARYDRASGSVATVAATQLDIIPYATIGTATELVQQITKVFGKVTGGAEVVNIEPAIEDYFMGVMYPNTLATSPDKASIPDFYYVYNRAVYLYPKPQANVDLYIHALIRDDVFTGDPDTTSLPERFDKVVIAQAESICARRAHDTDGMVAAQSVVRSFILDELGLEAAEMDEKVERIAPWRG